jgi:serine/threonine-protein kinase
MNPRRALDLAVQIGDGVADAHSAGIIHGDLRPDTIIVTGKGNAKILDFGLAQWTNGGMLRAAAARNPDAMSPESAAVLGYLSPEQAIGVAVDPRTDVFSLGTLAYEMLTGKNPFVGPTAGATVMNVIQGKFTPASEVNPAVPTELDAILAHALTPDLALRQQSAAALAAELRSVAAVLDVRTGDAVSPSALIPIDETPDKKAAGLLMGALALAAAAAVGVWWWLSR